MINSVGPNVLDKLPGCRRVTQIYGEQFEAGRMKRAPLTHTVTSPYLIVGVRPGQQTICQMTPGKAADTRDK
jgi:hypothetical protein